MVADYTLPAPSAPYNLWEPASRWRKPARQGCRGSATSGQSRGQICWPLPRRGQARGQICWPRPRRGKHEGRSVGLCHVGASTRAGCRGSATSGQARGQDAGGRPRRGKHAGRMPGVGHVGANSRADLLAFATSGQARGQDAGPRPRRGKHAGRSVGLGHVGANSRADFPARGHRWFKDDFQNIGSYTMQSILQITEGDFDGKSVRTTAEFPRRVSVIDVIGVVSGVGSPKVVWHNLQKNHPDVVDMVQYYQFSGQGQRPTPVAIDENIRWIARKVLCAARLPLSVKRLRLDSFCGHVRDLDLEIKKITEEEIMQDLCRAFAAFDPVKQFRVGPYRVDLYLKIPKIVVECDENGHRQYDACREVARQSQIQDKLGCSFVRFDPYARNFSMMDQIAQIINVILRTSVT